MIDSGMVAGCNMKKETAYKGLPFDMPSIGRAISKPGTLYSN